MADIQGKQQAPQKVLGMRGWVLVATVWMISCWVGGGVMDAHAQGSKSLKHRPKEEDVQHWCKGLQEGKDSSMT
jgi:hypothetical protein